ncbi:hypothetical protein CSUNSWCD_1280 [Campylobacter showae CSUNSWCD]|uniref:Uncharacterized protein n=1 Tax=Campylobacter showae CSUNSWCD TaxID=1244083 RepID=M5IRQ8_9BACT|nr:hypothetical protein CSUNSWCD_1280 [Campylobacter showae CSUNSWCD]
MIKKEKNKNSNHPSPPRHPKLGHKQTPATRGSQRAAAL